MKTNITLIAALGLLFFWFSGGLLDSIGSNPPPVEITEENAK